MTNFTRLSIHRLLPIFSWARQQPTHGVMRVPPQKALSRATELILFKDENPQEMSYTSLRDLMTANCHVCITVKPSGEWPQDEEERPAIKNRLVELAARAYLLPSHAQETPANQFFSRQWARLTSRTRLHSHDHSSINVLQSHVPCLPSPLWLDITRAFCSLFKLRPQPALRL